MTMEQNMFGYYNPLVCFTAFRSFKRPTVKFLQMCVTCSLNCVPASVFGTSYLTVYYT